MSVASKVRFRPPGFFLEAIPALVAAVVPVCRCVCARMLSPHTLAPHRTHRDHSPSLAHDPIFCPPSCLAPRSSDGVFVVVHG